MVAIISKSRIAAVHIAYFAAAVIDWRRYQNEVEPVVQAPRGGAAIVVAVGRLGVHLAKAVRVVPFAFHIDGVIEFIQTVGIMNQVLVGVFGGSIYIEISRKTEVSIQARTFQIVHQSHHLAIAFLLVVAAGSRFQVHQDKSGKDCVTVS